MEKVKITFLDGTEINADVNGTCYIVDQEPEFPIDLSIVLIDDGESQTEIAHAKVLECASVDGRYWFTFIQMSEEEIWRAEIEDALCELSMG